MNMHYIHLKLGTLNHNCKLSLFALCMSSILVMDFAHCYQTWNL